MRVPDRNELAVELRPGVFRPDWSIVTTDTVREALSARGAARARFSRVLAHRTAGRSILLRTAVVFPSKFAVS